MDRSKLLEFFDASQYDMPFNVVGCGAIGSHVCEELARLGIEDIHLYDFDTVDAHNITNQMFTQADIDKNKIDVCKEMIHAINPAASVTLYPRGIEEPYVCNGILILCVDNIDLRRAIVEANRYNPYCKAILDFRMRLTDAQHYFADASDTFQVDNLLSTMDFSHDEAKEATPTSACGVELSVVYTVKTITALGTANLVKWLLGQEDYKTMILADMNTFHVDAFKAKPRKQKSFIDNFTTAAKQG
jgi:molybdopterin/thiamine biosynthesis adenylyltransferase